MARNRGRDWARKKHSALRLHFAERVPVRGSCCSLPWEDWHGPRMESNRLDFQPPSAVRPVFQRQHVLHPDGSRRPVDVVAAWFLFKEMQTSSWMEACKCKGCLLQTLETSIWGVSSHTDIESLQGFRRFTYYLDRPDVMAKFTSVRLEADESKCPILSLDRKHYA